MDIIEYKPPRTVDQFICHYKYAELFYSFIVGPVGSGKTTGLFMKLVYMAQLQNPGPDGIRRTRAVIVRNTAPQLRDTTLVSWGYWFRDGVAGKWLATDKNFILRFGDVECVVMFRPLDTPDDISRVLSLEINFAILDEFVEIPRAIVEALSGRLGRFKLPDGTKPNIWGMWGSSNTSTEDNWWHDFLLRQSPDPEQNMPASGQYFLQPGGLHPDAENLDNLPGGRDYYVNLKKGKSDVWVNQFIHAQWGFSITGKPVVPAFKAALHVSKSRIQFNPHRRLIVGLDPGLGGTAALFAQEDSHGRLLFMGECGSVGLGAKRFISEIFRPYIRQHFPEAEIVIAPDPAAGNRSKRDEVPLVNEFKKYWEVRIETNNRLPLRLDAYEHYCTLLTDLGPAFQVDPVMCPMFVRALKGGWRYGVNQRTDTITQADPEKNKYSHYGDAGGYAARYFHRQGERERRYEGSGGRRPFTPPRKFGSSYHQR